MVVEKSEPESYKVELPPEKHNVILAVELKIPLSQMWRYRMNRKWQELKLQQSDINHRILERLRNDSSYRERMTNLSVTTSYSEVLEKTKRD